MKLFGWNYERNGDDSSVDIRYVRSQMQKSELVEPRNISCQKSCYGNINREEGVPAVHSTTSTDHPFLLPPCIIPCTIAFETERSRDLVS